MNNVYKVITSILNVRTGPSMNHQKVRTLYNGDVVTVILFANMWAKIGPDEYVPSIYITPIDNVLLANLAYDASFVNDIYPFNPYNRSIIFSQYDERWKDKPYKSHEHESYTIADSGSFPTALAMVINCLNRDSTYGPVEAVQEIVDLGYRGANITHMGIIKQIAVRYGFKYLCTVSIEIARNFLRDNLKPLVLCACKKEYVDDSEKFVVLYDIDYNGTCYYNNPGIKHHTELNKNNKPLEEFAKNITRYYCLSIPTRADELTEWSPKVEETVPLQSFLIAGSEVKARISPTTSMGDGNLIGFFYEGEVVYTNKKCGDWYYVTNTLTGNKEPSEAMKGWIPATYLNTIYDYGNIIYLQ